MSTAFSSNPDSLESSSVNEYVAITEPLLELEETHKHKHKHIMQSPSTLGRLWHKINSSDATNGLVAIGAIERANKLNNENIGLSSVLSHTRAIDLLMLHLAKEWSIECLLSLIEFSHCQKYVYDHVLRTCTDSYINHSAGARDVHVSGVESAETEMQGLKSAQSAKSEESEANGVGGLLKDLERDMFENKYGVKWPASIPKSSIVYDNYWKEYERKAGDEDEMFCGTPVITWIDNCKNKAFKLYSKYIEVGSQYEINIAWRTRNSLTATIGHYSKWMRNENVKEKELFYLFHQCCNDMVHLLHGSFSRFQTSPNFTKLKDLIMIEN